jgi:N-acetylglucosaminyldiphosphoundecaprenol N-acetyl-beta-D-mannosaminyltransferase
VRRINVLGVGISATDPRTTLDQIVEWIETGQKQYVCVCAVHTVMECQHDLELRDMVNSAGLAVPDGMPLVWISHMSGQPAVRRVYGPDLMLAFCQLAAHRGYRSYFLGGAQGQPEILAEKLTARFPGLAIDGLRATPNRPVPKADNEAIIQDINRANPDVVWVGMGTGFQERWMAVNRSRLNAPVLIGVGAAFDMHSGWVPQAPKWMQNAGLEWLFRLSREPRRLWRRYLVGNSQFVLRYGAQHVGLVHYSMSGNGRGPGADLSSARKDTAPPSPNPSGTKPKA